MTSFEAWLNRGFQYSNADRFCDNFNFTEKEYHIVIRWLEKAYIAGWNQGKHENNKNGSS